MGRWLYCYCCCLKGKDCYMVGFGVLVCKLFGLVNDWKVKIFWVKVE